MIGSILRVVGYVIDRVILLPVREGSLRDTGWPRWLRATIIAFTALYLLGGASILLAPWLRTSLPLSTGLPDLTVPWTLAALALVMLAFAATLTFVAAERSRSWLVRGAGWLVVSAFILRGLGATQVDWSRQQPWELWFALVSPLLLLVHLLWRHLRPRGGSWDVVVLLLVVGDALVLPSLALPAVSYGSSVDLRVRPLLNLLEMLWPLAVPGLALAGAAMAELAVSTASWTVTAVDRSQIGRVGTPRGRLALALLALGVVLTLLIASTTWDVVVEQSPDLRPELLLTSTLVHAAALVPGALAWWWADRVAGDLDVRPDPDDLPPVWRTISPWLGVTVAVATAPLLVGGVLTAFGALETGSLVIDLGSRWWSPLLLAATSVVGVRAVLAARRGLRLTAMSQATFVGLILTLAVAEQFRLVISNVALVTVPPLLAVVLLIWLVLTHRVDVTRVSALSGVVLACLFWKHREWLDDPLTQLFSMAGLSVGVLVGMVWKLLTEAHWTRRGSWRFPVPTRVLLALANALFVLTLAVLIAGFGGNIGFRIDQVERVGDNFIGRVFVLLACLIGLTLAASGTQRRFTRGSAQLH